MLGWLFLRYGMAAAIGGHVTYNSLLLSPGLPRQQIPEPVSASDHPHSGGEARTKLRLKGRFLGCVVPSGSDGGGIGGLRRPDPEAPPLATGCLQPRRPRREGGAACQRPRSTIGPAIGAGAARRGTAPRAAGGRGRGRPLVGGAHRAAVDLRRSPGSSASAMAEEALVRCDGLSGPGRGLTAGAGARARRGSGTSGTADARPSSSAVAPSVDWPAGRWTIRGPRDLAARLTGGPGPSAARGAARRAARHAQRRAGHAHRLPRQRLGGAGAHRRALP